MCATCPSHSILHQIAITVTCDAPPQVRNVFALRDLIGAHSFSHIATEMLASAILIMLNLLPPVYNTAATTQKSVTLLKISKQPELVIKHFISSSRPCLHTDHSETR